MAFRLLYCLSFVLAFRLASSPSMAFRLLYCLSSLLSSDLLPALPWPSGFSCCDATWMSRLADLMDCATFTYLPCESSKRMSL
jgi:hypothetical protein